MSDDIEARVAAAAVAAERERWQPLLAACRQFMSLNYSDDEAVIGRVVDALAELGDLAVPVSDTRTDPEWQEYSDQRGPYPEPPQVDPECCTRCRPTIRMNRAAR